MWRKKARNLADNFKSTGEFVNCIARLFVFEDFKNYFEKKDRKKPLMVLANGPSLNESLEKIIANKEYLNHDIATVNFMTNDERFYIIRPCYHVISDGMFYNVPSQQDRVEKFFNNLNNKINWKITLFASYEFWKDNEWKRRITNDKVKVVPLHRQTPPWNAGKLTLFLAKKGLLGADFGSVLHHAINMGIMSGYKKVILYGSDHTFFDGLCVDNNNRVCKKTTHFYDDKPEEVKPVFHTWSGKDVPYTMSFFLYEYMRVFRGHEILRNVADYFGVDIINKTPCSMIDSYKRA